MALPSARRARDPLSDVGDEFWQVARNFLADAWAKLV